MKSSMNLPPAITEAEIRRFRAETPAADAGRIHLNNAGASLMPVSVVSAIREHLDLESKLGGYEAADASAADVSQVYESIATLVGSHRDQIAIVENATVAVAQALSAFDFRAGDVLVTTRNDYISNQLMYLSLARRTGLRLERAADLSEGGVDPDSVRQLVRQHRPKLVAVTWVPTNSGLVQPVEAVGEICAAEDVPFLVDGCQAAGQLPIDVQRLQCDFLAATGRKFMRGPRGTGFLYVSPKMLEAGLYPRFLDMRGARWLQADEFELAPDATRFENWEFPYALVLGLGQAVRYALDIRLDRIAARVNELATYTREKLGALNGVRILDRGARLCGIVTAEIAGHEAREVMLRLREEAINTSATAREFAVLDMDDKRAETALRVSPHYYNTRREIDILSSALEEFTS